jgi:hypothetical protein
MTEPAIVCPNCESEIKLTESLAAPLIEATRQQFEHTIAEKEAEIAKREAAILEQKATIEKAREAIDEQVSHKLKAEREKIVAEEAKKARLILEIDIEQRTKENLDLQEVLKERDIKLAEAQKTQVDLLRKQRELDDAKRELDLTVEKKVQDSLTAVQPEDMRFVCVGETAEGDAFAFKGYMAYQGELFGVSMRVHKNGTVEMVDDDPMGFIVRLH